MKKSSTRNDLKKARRIEFVIIGMVISGFCWILGAILIIMGARIIGMIATSISVIAWLYFYLGWRKIKGLPMIPSGKW